MNGSNAFVVTGRRVMLPRGVRPAAVAVREGRIQRVEPLTDFRPGSDGPVVDAGDDLVLPGFVDTHVHVDEPGRTEWEGFRTATDAAAAAGITMIVDMPLNCAPVTCSAEALDTKRRAATGQLRVDCGFWGGVIPGNRDELKTLAEAGALGFKCFLVDSGLPEFPPVDEPELRAAMREIARLGLPLLAHAELPGPIAAAAPGRPRASRRHADWLASRPAAAEVEAVRLLVGLAEQTGCRVHVVHVSAAECLPVLAAAKAADLPVTAETCPHYLTFTAEEVPEGATGFKCAPPIRPGANREALWRGLADGVLDLVASDHSPCPPEARSPVEGDFFRAWGGIASLQLGPSAVWTEARSRGVPPDRLAEWMAAAPARLAGLAHRKGRIAPGTDADLVILDPEAEFVVEAEALLHRHRETPYAGRRLRGVIRRTWVRGHLVYADGELTGARPGLPLHPIDAGDR